MDYSLKNKILILPIIFLAVFIFAQTAHADTLGQNEKFFIDSSYDADSGTSAGATLRYISGHAYFYVQDKYWDALSQELKSTRTEDIRALAAEFDSVIYPRMISFFGSEPNPGIDNDSKITILLTRLVPSAGGYFDTGNQYSVNALPHSNEREMIYLNVEVLNDKRKISMFLAHEFQHLISFEQKDVIRKVQDDIWLNELRSEYAVEFLGYNNELSGSNIERRLRAFLLEPYGSITEWKNKSPDYGEVALFGRYLAEKYSPKVIADTLKNNLAGVRSVNESLHQNGFDDNFLQVFNNWLIANSINNVNFGDELGYSGGGLYNFTVKPGSALSGLGNDAIFAINDNIKDWSGSWYEVVNFKEGPDQDFSDTLEIEVISPSLNSFLVTALVLAEDGRPAVYSFEPTQYKNKIYLDGINHKFSKIILIPIKKDRLSGFGSDEMAIALSLNLRRLDDVPAGFTALNLNSSEGSTSPPVIVAADNNATPSPQVLSGLPDGSLVRMKGDYKVYVINGRWRRHIVSPHIFDFYSHLGFDKVI